MYQKDKNSIIPWGAAFPQTLEILKTDKFDFNKVDFLGKTLLHYAASYDNADICEFIYIFNNEETKSLIEKRDNREITALHYAAENNCQATTEFLISHGFDVNDVDWETMSPLHYAAKNNCKETAEILLSKGAEVNSIDRAGKTPLHYAAMKNCKDIAEILVSHGANLNAKDDDGLTPLDTAKENNSKEISRYLSSLQKNTDKKKAKK